MEKKKLNEEIANMLKAPGGSTEPYNDEQLKDIIGIADEIPVGEEEVDLLYDPRDQNVIEFKKNADVDAQPMLNFIPLAEFKPDVYGLSDDIFDQVEQFGTELPAVQTGETEIETTEEIPIENDLEDFEDEGEKSELDNSVLDIIDGDEINGGEETAIVEPGSEEIETIERNFIKLTIELMGKANKDMVMNFFGDESTMINNMLIFFRQRLESDTLSKIVRDQMPT